MSPSSTIDLSLFLATTGPSGNVHSRKKVQTAKAPGGRRPSPFFKFYPTTKRNSVVPKHIPLPVKYEVSPQTTTSSSSSVIKTCTPSSSTTTTNLLASSFPQVPQVQPPAPPTTPQETELATPGATSCPYCARPIPSPTPPPSRRRARRVSCPAAIKYIQQPQAKLGLTSQEAKTLLQMIEGLQQQIIKEKAYRHALEDALYSNV